VVRQKFKVVNWKCHKMYSIILLRGTWIFFILFKGTRKKKVGNHWFRSFLCNLHHKKSDEISDDHLQPLKKMFLHFNNLKECGKYLLRRNICRNIYCENTSNILQLLYDKNYFAELPLFIELEERFSTVSTGMYTTQVPNRNI